MKRSKKQKIVVVVGPTSSGKSDLAVDIAKQFNGEVISADSRQVYSGLDIATGKITKAEMKDVKHHLLDVVSPKEVFTVVDFKEKAEEAILDIASRGRLPIIAGGTGFYIQAVVDGIVLPKVEANQKLRNELRKKSADELFEELSQLDPHRAASIDSKNKQRLIRAVEIVRAIGSVPKTTKANKYDVLTIGIDTKDDELKARIKKRLHSRIKSGMIEEAKNLHKNGLTYKRMKELGLEYRYLAEFLMGEISRKEMLKEIEIKNWQYARRQKTWFKRDKGTKWYSLNDQKVFNEIKSFLKN